MCLIDYTPCKHKEKIGYKIMATTHYGLVALFGPWEEGHRFRVGYTYQSKCLVDRRMTTPYEPGFNAYARLSDAVEEICFHGYNPDRGRPVIVKVRLFDVHTKGRDISHSGRNMPCFVGRKQQILKIYQPRELERYRRKL